MKTTPVSLIVVGMLAQFGAFAQSEPAAPAPPPGDGGARRGGAHPFVEAWQAADKNHDGVLSKDEFDLMPRIQNLPEEKRLHLFERLDKDGDGKLSREELGRIGHPHDPQGPPRQRLWELDADKSGGISFEEFKAGQFFKKLPPARQEAMFRRLDTDGDGLITPKDKPEPVFKHEGGKQHQPHSEGGPPDGHRMESRQIIRQLDQNGDGVLSLEEFRAAPAVKDLTAAEQQERFSAMDRNHDQKITAEDFPSPPARGESKHGEGAHPAPASAAE